MELEKIKIYVTKRVADILQKDTENFDFFKKDGITPNKNAFLTTLILNYFEEYQRKQEKINSLLKNILKENTSFEDVKIKELSNLINNKINKEISINSVEKFDCLVSLKPTKDSQSIISYIEEYLLNNRSLSEYFRNMFIAYTALPQDMREQIIFKSQFNAINEAIKNGNKIFINTKATNSNRMEVLPYTFANSKEEIHLYLLYQNRQTFKSIKLSRIQSVVILDKKEKISPKGIEIFNKMIKYGPQFYYEENEEEVVLKLSQNGQMLFRKMYVHRPIPESINKNMYTFKCAHTQIMQYFSRFGGEVEIISPQSIKENLYKFHNEYVLKNQ